MPEGFTFIGAVRQAMRLFHSFFVLRPVPGRVLDAVLDAVLDVVMDAGEPRFEREKTGYPEELVNDSVTHCAAID